ncbi:MAG: hypothetical protein ABI874_07900 [Chloroflexota bacterium]
MDRWKSFFTIAAIYHVGVGIGLAVFARQVLGALNFAPELYAFSFHVLLFRILGLASLAFGVGYYFVSRAPAQNVDLVKVALIFKLGVVAICAYYALRGEFLLFLAVVALVNDLIWIPFLAWFAMTARHSQ